MNGFDKENNLMPDLSGNENYQTKNGFGISNKVII
jgi:hypothetical protein